MIVSPNKELLMSDNISTTELESPVSIGDWILTWILLAIPLLNIIMLFVWALSSNTKKSKQNFARASFVVFFFFMGLSFLMMVVLGLSSSQMTQQF